MEDEFIKLANPLVGICYANPQHLVNHSDVRIYSNDLYYCEISKYVLAATSRLGKRLLPSLTEDLNAITTDLSKDQLEIAVQLMVNGTVPLKPKEFITDILSHLEIDIQFSDLVKVCPNGPVSIPTFRKVAEGGKTNKGVSSKSRVPKTNGNHIKITKVEAASAVGGFSVVESDFTGKAPTRPGKKIKSEPVEAFLEAVTVTEANATDSWDDSEDEAEANKMRANKDGYDEIYEADIKLEVEHPKVIPLFANKNFLLCKKFKVNPNAVVILPKMKIPKTETKFDPAAASVGVIPLGAAVAIKSDEDDEEDFGVVPFADAAAADSDSEMDDWSKSSDFSTDESDTDSSSSGEDSTDDEKPLKRRSSGRNARKRTSKARGLGGRGSRSNHKRRRRNGGGGEHSCDLCEKDFPNHTALRRHMECHSEGMVTCSFAGCDHTTHTINLVTQHYTGKHRVKFPQVSRCPFCQQVVRSKHWLDNHLQNAHGRCSVPTATTSHSTSRGCSAFTTSRTTFRPRASCAGPTRRTESGWKSTWRRHTQRLS